MNETQPRPLRRPAACGDPSVVRAALGRAGHRFTEQRAAVYDALCALGTHPTADEIFRTVRLQVPDISLATVYKALEAFESAGACLRLADGDGPARYDARTDGHHHLRCVDCGRVVDVEGPPVGDWLARMADLEDCELLDCRLVLVGRCGRCREAVPRDGTRG
ncbi:MAG: transcriptional repressor [Gemmatimonadota bacterium]|nr:transcriptional repressor [Gemmatimonadota bacterium]